MIPHSAAFRLWRALFATPINAALSLCGIVLLVVLIPPLAKWTLIDAAILGDSRDDCIVHSGMCWPYVKAKFGQWIYGRYPLELRWRADLAFALFAAAALWMIHLNRKGGGAAAWLILPCYLPIAFVLLYGGFGFAVVETPLWGGFMLTLVVAAAGIIASLPLGILLALARRAENLPVIRLLAICFIEFVRGVPLITVLFMASVMLPLFLPEGVNFDKLLRALVGVALFAAAYMAEVVRGGLQAIPSGQMEAAKSLGLGYWHAMRLIVLPQALRISIPGVVNSFIGLFKDTTLVLIIGLFDLLGMAQLSGSDPAWTTPATTQSGYLVVAFIFWICCFGMSRFSRNLERRLSAGRGHRA